MENEQTQKYQNFIFAKDFLEDRKIPESEFYTLKKTTSIPITLPWKCPPGEGKVNYLYAEALLFL